MQQHTIHLWYCFPITITKVDLEGEVLVCVPISPRIHSSLNDCMKLKIASVFPLITIDDFIISVIQSLCNLQKNWTNRFYRQELSNDINQLCFTDHSFHLIATLQTCNQFCMQVLILSQARIKIHWSICFNCNKCQFVHCAKVSLDSSLEFLN